MPGAGEMPIVLQSLLHVLWSSCSRRFDPRLGRGLCGQRLQRVAVRYPWGDFCRLQCTGVFKSSAIPSVWRTCSGWERNAALPPGSRICRATECGQQHPGGQQVFQRLREKYVVRHLGGGSQGGAVGQSRSECTRSGEVRGGSPNCCYQGNGCSCRNHHICL